MDENMVMDENIVKAIENNLMMLNSGIKLLLCNGKRLSAEMIETEFKTTELLIGECKRLMYSAIEE